MYLGSPSKHFVRKSSSSRRKPLSRCRSSWCFWSICSVVVKTATRFLITLGLIFILSQISHLFKRYRQKEAGGDIIPHPLSINSSLPLGQDTAIDQAALVVVLDHRQDHRVPLAELPVGMLGGVEAQTGGAVRHGAEHAAAVLPADDRMRPAARSYSLRMQSWCSPGRYCFRRSS